MLILSIPYVQTQLGKKLTNELNKEYDTNINIGRVGVTFFGDVSLKDVYIEDHHQDTLAFIGAINTSILDFKELSEGDLLFSDVEIDELDFIIRNYKGETYTSLDVFIEKWEKYDTIPRIGPSTFLMTAKGVDIENSRFRYIDENLETPKILDFTNLNIEGDDFKINGSNVSVNITEADMLDYRGVQIEQLSTNFTYTLTQMQFENIDLKTKYSSIKGDLVFDYIREDFSDFNNKVKLTANFSDSKVAYRDLNKFYDEFGNDVATFTARVEGTLNDLNLPRFKLKTLNNTVIDGDFNFKNLFTKNEDDFRLIAKFDNLRSTYTDLKKMLPRLLGKTIPSSFRNLGVFTVNGESVIANSFIDADLDVKTSIGNIRSDLKLSHIDNIDQANYKGTTSFSNFNLGVLIDDRDLGKSSFDVEVDGEGFTLEHLSTLVKGKVDYLEYNGYKYQHMDVYGLIKNKVFNGNLVSYDKNLMLTFDGLIDMSSEVDTYDFKAEIVKADLNKINLFKRDEISLFKGDIIMNMKGSSFDDVAGEILFKNTSYTNQNDHFYFKDFKISSSFDEQKIRTIAINSPEVINGKIEGKFKFAEVLKLVENSLGSIYTNYNPLKVSKDQFFNFNIRIKNRLTEIFYPDIVIHNSATIRGKMSSNENDFKLTLKSPKISYKDNNFDNINIQVDNTNPLFNTYINVSDIKTKYYDVADFNLINKTLNDTLFFRTEFKGGNRKRDNYNLNLYHTINKDNKSVVGFKKSDININDYDWFINNEDDKENKIVFDKDFKEIDIKTLLINHGAEYLKLSGELRGESNKNIKLELKDINLAKVLPKVDSLDFQGVINGKVAVKQEKGKYQPTAGIVVSNLNVNKNTLGEFKLDITGDDNLTNYQINSSLVNENLKSLLANGNIDFGFDTPYLNLDVELNKFDLSMFSALGEDVITNIRGFTSGTANLEGDYDNPDFKGTLYLDESGLKIPYLNIDFDFENNARVRLDKKRFIFDNIAILDTKHYTSGRLNGFIAHEFFSDWELGLSVSSDNLLVLDKKQEEESLYYGKAFIQGVAELTGPTDELLVKVNATTKKGTVFKIPISDAEAVGDNSFIRVLSKEEKLNLSEVDANLPEDISGLELEFDLDVTPDAEIEIVVDQKSGSVLRGRGSGLLRIEINTNDKFNMYGDFIVSEGTYNFVYGSNFLQGGFIEKRFQVKPGGTINWDGSPYKARVDINAVYKTSANPAILLDNPSINRKIPVDVVINLNGGLLQPDVNFEIQFPNTNSVVKSELLYKLDDKEFRDKQALSLVTSGQFTNAFAIGQGAITGNLVERATSLVNDIFSEEDDKFKIGLNYEQGENNPYLADQRTEDRVGVTLSTQISDRVIINGRVGIPVGGVTKTVVAGDVQVEFLLNEQGTLRAKIFNRENDFQLSGLANEIGYTQGVGISYQVNFDKFSELIDQIFKRKKNKEEKGEKEEEQSSDFIRKKPRN